ncbi:MAG: DegT/DnrJ/EryC1/StrS family aminotransferase [Candidatus Aenigmatarchaeota archaeon]
MKKYKIPLIKSTFYNEQETKRKLVSFILKSKKLSMGKYVERFEQKFAKWQGRKYAVMFNSGSSANLALIQTLLNLELIQKGDKVGISGITWSTNVMPIIQLGLNPILIDVSLETLNITPITVEEMYGKYKFKVLFITHLLGFCDDIVKIQNFCSQNKILLIEDTCESYGSEYLGKKLGNFGLASTFSFFVGHQMSTIEGGMVCTDDKDIFDMLKIVRAHGWARNLDDHSRKKFIKKFKVEKFYEPYTFYDLGYNLRPTEIQGYLGLIQLGFLDEIIKKREDNFYKLSKVYDDFSPYLQRVSNKNLTRLSNFGFPIICKNKQTRILLTEYLSKKGIEIRPIVGGSIATQPFFQKYIKKKFDLPNSNYINENGFYFGNNPEMTDGEIKFVINTFKNFFKNK